MSKQHEHANLLEFSPPNHKHNQRRLSESLKRAELERLNRIGQAKSSGQLLVFDPKTFEHVTNVSPVGTKDFGRSRENTSIRHNSPPTKCVVQTQLSTCPSFQDNAFSHANKSGYVRFQNDPERRIEKVAAVNSLNVKQNKQMLEDELEFLIKIKCDLEMEYKKKLDEIESRIKSVEQQMQKQI